MTFVQQMFITLIGAVVGGSVGFIFAYRMALVHHRWDLAKAASELRRSRVDAIRVPLETVRAQIQSEVQLQEYFNRETELMMLRQIGEAVYALGGTALARAFENAKRTLHEYAQTTLNTKPAGEKCLTHIDGILGELGS